MTQVGLLWQEVKVKMKIIILVMCIFLLSSCAVMKEGVNTLVSDDVKDTVEKPESFIEDVEVEEGEVEEVTEKVDVEDIGEDLEDPAAKSSSGYTINIMDKMLRECNVACCGEETPASCDNECRWPEYINCFHGCMDKHPEASYNCDAECWPEHKAYFETKTVECLS